MAEENANFVKKITTKLTNTLFGKMDTEVQSTEYRRDKGFKTFYKYFSDWYFENVVAKSKNRKERYERADFLDDNLPEAEAVLNGYADNIVSGAIGGEENFKVAVDDKTPNREEIEKVVKEMEARTEIKDHIWEISRNLTKFADVWEEVVVNSPEPEEFYIGKFKKLPEQSMYADVDERGVWKDPEFPYYQKTDDMSEQERIRFYNWRIIHFKIGQGIYGVDNSIFRRSSQRYGRQLLWLDDSIVLARMTRAWQRYAYLIDTKGLSPDAAWDYVEQYMENVRRKEVVESDTGRINVYDAPPLPDEDLGVPVAEGSKTDIKVLSGDLNIGNIEDVLYLQRKFFMATNFPKAYAGLEEGVRSKATLSQIDVQFARQVRRRQHALIPGLTKAYQIEFVLHGIDPEAFEWAIVFPELATTDELIKWEIEKVKSEIAERYVAKIGTLNDRWVMEEILGFTEEQVQKYASILPGEPGEEQVQLPPETAMMVRRDPHVRAILSDLKDLIAQKLAREEELEGKKLIGIEREKSLRDKYATDE